MLVLRPRPDGQAEPLMVHVLEADILRPPLDLLARIGILAKGKTGIAAQGVPLGFRMLRLQRSILGIDMQVILVELGIAARLRRVETLADQHRPV